MNTKPDAPRTDNYDEPFTCPKCGGSKFDLVLGGRNHGRIECSNPTCGFPVSTGNGQQDT